MDIKPFVGNNCGFGNCLDGCCEKCRFWNPCIYFGKTYRYIKLPRWVWLANLLYKIEASLLERSCPNEF